MPADASGHRDGCLKLFVTLLCGALVFALQGCGSGSDKSDAKGLPMSRQQLEGACPDYVARCKDEEACASALRCMEPVDRCHQVNSCLTSTAANSQSELLTNLSSCLDRICQDNSWSTNVPLVWGTADCFVSPTFTRPEIALHADWEYGRAYNPWTKENETLTLDAYFPPEQDQRSARPVVVLMHGGAFTGGDSQSDGIPDLAYALAMRGYVVASLNYRLVPVSPSALHEFFSSGPAKVASEDARAAVRFVRAHAKEWRVDESRIVIGGDSAGAISALYYGYFPNATEGTSGNPDHSSAVNAVLSISGEMKVQAFCTHIERDLTPDLCTIPGPPLTHDLTDQMGSGGIPLIEIHGTDDHIVPYINGWEASARANFTGNRNLFVSIEGGGHVPMDEALDDTKPFLNTWLTFLSGALDLQHAECPSATNIVTV